MNAEQKYMHKRMQEYFLILIGCMIHIVVKWQSTTFDSCPLSNYMTITMLQ